MTEGTMGVQATDAGAIAATLAPVENAVRVRNVVKRYEMGDTVVDALRGVNLEIRRGEYISIVGPSGSGKSTLFNMVGGLDKPTEGRVYIDEVDIAQLDARELAWLRCRKIGYIFQSFNLIPTLSAVGNVSLPLIFSGTSESEAEKRAASMLDRVGLGHRLTHRPEELSGGQRQRVACARALVNEPAVILADEPTGNLDLKTGEDILALLKELQTESGATVICATHDHKMLAASDRVVWIVDGCIDQIKHREELDISIGSMDGQTVA